MNIESPNTFLQQLLKMGAEIESLSSQLLEVSDLIHSPPAPSEIVVVFIADWVWSELDAAGQSIQHKTHTKYEKFRELARVTLSVRVPSKLEKFEELSKQVLPFIEQQEDQYRSIQKLYDEVLLALKEQKKILKSLCPLDSSPVPILVPDTNAFIGCPLVENFQISQESKVEIILVPTVVSELDKLKVHARNSDVRDKVKKIIRQFKEMRRRGQLAEGVSVTQNITLRAIATEPNSDKAISWLDFDNLDDRIIASVLEVTRENLDSPVILVTSDLNLQTKAELAQIPYQEPPEVPNA